MTRSTSPLPMRRVLLALTGSVLAALALVGCRAGAPPAPVAVPERGLAEHREVWPASHEGRHLGGQGQRVAVLDTGLSPTYAERCAPCRVSVATGPLLDEIGHGTSVTAIISGYPAASYSGIAPGAEVTVFPLAPRQGQTVHGSALARAVDEAVAGGFDVVNISVGSQTPDAALDRSVRAAHAAGVVVIASAGPNPTEITLYPAAFPDVLAAVADHGHGHGQGHEEAGHAHDDDASSDSISAATSSSATGLVQVPLAGLELPEYDAEARSLALRQQDSSSAAAAVLSGLAAVHRSTAACSPARDFENFLIQVRKNADTDRPLLQGLAHPC